MGKTGIVAVLLVVLIGGEGLIYWLQRQEPVRVAPKETNLVVEPKFEEIKVAAVGDVMLSRTVDEQMKLRGDWTWPFASTAAELRAADLTIGNLETPILPDCPPMTNRMIFCAEEESVAGLVAAGFDAVSLANNHSLNMGREGLEQTEMILAKAGIVGVREGEIEYVEVRGVKVGLIAFDEVSKPVAIEGLEIQVTEAATQAAIVIVMPHWGAEYMAVPSEQVRLRGRRLVAAGAEAVVGAHPHWTQTTEEIEGKVIVYSLGNFVFDQMWSEETRRGTAVRFDFEVEDSKVRDKSYELWPVRIYDYGQPRWVE